MLVTPNANHAFCSSYDFGPWPLLSFVNTLSLSIQDTLESTAALFINGFVFDEVPCDVVLAAARCARNAGAAVFFDPGPRAWTFNEDPRKSALHSMLDLSDVVLMTLEEAEAVTGCADAESAAMHVLDRPGAATEWCIVKKGSQGALVATKSPSSIQQNMNSGSGSGSNSGDSNTTKSSSTDDQTTTRATMGRKSDAFVIEQRALNVDVRDTVGCGDSFAAAVVLGYVCLLVSC